MSTQRTSLRPAKLGWTDDGSPYNTEFDDIYFAPNEGREESDYVFLRGNNLQQRWCETNGLFSIAETGFGTGLNFLLTLQLWRRTINTDDRWHQLHYYSAEKHPVTQQDLLRALSAFPELDNDAQTLAENYPPLLEGFYTIQFTPQVQLHLLFGCAEKGFAQLRDSDRRNFAVAGIDAWFLDGFAPGKNPAMWSAALLRSVADLSQSGTTFSTFSAAGALRRELQSQGFAVHKDAGFGRKREMLRGEFIGPHSQTKFRRNKHFPAATWYAPAQNPRVEATLANSSHRRVAVIGAGLAGCLTAESLARRGMDVTLLDSGDQPASGASAVPKAALYTRLSPHRSTANDFALYAYLLATQYYNAKLESAPEGLIELQGTLDAQQQASATAAHLNNKDIAKYLRVEEGSRVAGVALEHPALFYPQGRLVDPKALCLAIIESHSTIEFKPKVTVTALEHTGQHWQLFEEGSRRVISQADTVVVCTGPNSKWFSQLSWLPTRLIRGQTALVASTAESQQLRTVLCGDSYLTPAVDGWHCAGSSYGLNDGSTDLDEQEHSANLTAASRLLSSLNTNVTTSPVNKAWAGTRCVSPDYLPLVGPVPVLEQFEQQFSKLQHDKNAPLAIDPAYWPQLYLNTAMGSRGLCFAPMCAELIASQIRGELSPLPAPLRHALLPARFIVRNISRGDFASNKNCA